MPSPTTGRPCSVCRHPQRGEIDQGLVAGEPLRRVSEHFGTSAQALIRHRDKHLPQLAEAAKALETADAERAENLVDLVRTLRRDAASLLAEARQAGDRRGAVAAIGASLKCIETQAKLTGAFRQTLEVSGPGGGPIPSVSMTIPADLSALSDAELSKLYLDVISG